MTLTGFVLHRMDEDVRTSNRQMISPRGLSDGREVLRCAQNDIWGTRNGSGKRIWRMLGGIVVDHDSRSARRFKWGSWMAKSQL